MIVSYGDAAEANAGMMQLATKFRMTVGLDEMQTAAEKQMRELQEKMKALSMLNDKLKSGKAGKKIAKDSVSVAASSSAAAAEEEEEEEESEEEEVVESEEEEAVLDESDVLPPSSVAKKDNK